VHFFVPTSYIETRNAHDDEEMMLGYMIISFALSADFRIFSILFFLDQSVFDINDNGNSILRLIGSN